MTNTLQPAPIKSSQFTYDANTRQYVGEVSSTNGFGRVYSDACDEGLTIVSTRTGARVVFVITEVDRDAEGEVISWLLRPAASFIPTESRHLASVSLRLFND